MAQRVVIVIDMQNGVFSTPRFDQAGRIVRINRLIEHADTVLFIQHREGTMCEGDPGFELLPALVQPAGAFYVTKNRLRQLLADGAGRAAKASGDKRVYGMRMCD